MEPQETTVWSGTSSQWVNFGTYLLCLLFCWLIVPIFIAVYKYLEVKTRRYELTTERLRITHGILTKHTEEIELYRVKDSALVEPFPLRLFSLGDIVLDTSDKTMPRVSINAIRDAKEVREQLRKQVETQRQTKRVREVD